MSEFDAVTAVHRRPDSTIYDADLHPGWAIGGKPNGGYLLALLARAGCDVVGSVHPLAVSAHYLRAPSAGSAEIHTEVVRLGRRVCTSRATLWQAGKPCIDALITSGELHADTAAWDAAPPPPMPAPQECVSAATPRFDVELFRHVELLLDPATAPFPKPSGDPRIRFWFRLRDGSPPDVLSLLLAPDSGPPTVFNLGIFGWSPTVELTVLLRGLPAPGWLLCESDAQLLAGGWFDEQASVWDSSGRLVAQARQLALTAE